MEFVHLIVLLDVLLLKDLVFLVQDVRVVLEPLKFVHHVKVANILSSRLENVLIVVLEIPFVKEFIAIPHVCLVCSLMETIVNYVHQIVVLVKKELISVLVVLEMLLIFQDQLVLQFALPDLLLIKTFVKDAIEAVYLVSPENQLIAENVQSDTQCQLNLEFVLQIVVVILSITEQDVKLVLLLVLDVLILQDVSVVLVLLLLLLKTVLA